MVSWGNSLENHARLLLFGLIKGILFQQLAIDERIVVLVLQTVMNKAGNNSISPL